MQLHDLIHDNVLDHGIIEMCVLCFAKLAANIGKALEGGDGMQEGGLNRLDGGRLSQGQLIHLRIDAIDDFRVSVSILG